MRRFWISSSASARVAFACVALGLVTGSASIAVAFDLGGGWGAAAMALAYALGTAPVGVAGLMVRQQGVVKIAGALLSGFFAAFLLSSLLNLANEPVPQGRLLADFFDVLVFLGAIAAGLALAAIAIISAGELRQEARAGAATGTRSPRRSVR